MQDLFYDVLGFAVVIGVPLLLVILANDITKDIDKQPPAPDPLDWARTQAYRREMQRRTDLEQAARLETRKRIKSRMAPDYVLYHELRGWPWENKS